MQFNTIRNVQMYLFRLCSLGCKLNPGKILQMYSQNAIKIIKFSIDYFQIIPEKPIYGFGYKAEFRFCKADIVDKLEYTRLSIQNNVMTNEFDTTTPITKTILY